MGETNDGRVYEVIGEPATGGPFVFTCEHATRLLPEWRAMPDDVPYLEEHWGWDIGAADLTRALIELTSSCGVLSRFSRLVCDPNRRPDQKSFIVEEVDGYRLDFNRDLDAAERRRRRERYFDPYHAAVDRIIRQRKALGTPVRLCAIHSFTPTYLGRARPMEVGVLFDAHELHAWRLEGALIEEGFEAALNAPYSGKDGMTYSAERHGGQHDLVHLELEVRQDLIATRERAHAIAERVARALGSFAPDPSESRR